MSKKSQIFKLSPYNLSNFLLRIKSPAPAQPEYRSFTAPSPNSRQGHQQGHFDNYRPTQPGQPSYQPNPARQAAYQPGPASYQPNPAGQASYRPSPAEPVRPLVPSPTQTGQLQIVEIHKTKPTDVYDNEQVSSLHGCFFG